MKKVNEISKKIINELDRYNKLIEEPDFVLFPDELFGDTRVRDCFNLDEDDVDFFEENEALFKPFLLTDEVKQQCENHKNDKIELNERIEKQNGYTDEQALELFHDFQCNSWNDNEDIKMIEHYVADDKSDPHFIQELILMEYIPYNSYFIVYDYGDNDKILHSNLNYNEAIKWFKIEKDTLDMELQELEENKNIN